MLDVPKPRPRFLKPVLTAGIVAGILDLALAIIFFALRGAPLIAVPRAIAAGLLGRDAFHGGIAVAVLGVALHFFIALTVAAVYYALSRKIKFLNRHPILSGAVYGLAVFVVMQHIVVPLSRAAHGHSSHPDHGWLVANIASHIFFIGITIALITRHCSPQIEAP